MVTFTGLWEDSQRTLHECWDVIERSNLNDASVVGFKGNSWTEHPQRENTQAVHVVRGVNGVATRARIAELQTILFKTFLRTLVLKTQKKQNKQTHVNLTTSEV